MRSLAYLAATVAVAACSSAPGTVTAPGAGPGAAIDAAPPVPVDADPDQITLYKAGKLVTRPRAFATDHDGCLGTAADLAACTRLSTAAAPCDLAAWPDAGAVYCRGAAMGPEDMLPRAPPPCGCTCSADYQKAHAALMARVQACGRVP
jgi:hypothetical protein